MTLLATDRYRLAMRELTWNPDRHRRQPRRPRPGPHAVRDRPQPRRRRLDRRRARRPPPAVTGSSASRPAAAAPPPASSTASTPRSPRSSRRPPRPRPSSAPPSSSRPSSASPSSPSATPRCGCASPSGQVAIEAGTGDDAQASEAVECTLTGPEIEIAFNPHLPARRPRRGRHRLDPDVLHPGLAPGRALRPGERRRRGRHLVPLRPHAGPLRLLTRGPRPVRRRCRGVACGAASRHLDEGAPGCSSDWSAWARWAATCASGCAAPATRSSATTATRPSRTPAPSPTWSRSSTAPRVVWVMVPHGAPDPRHRRRPRRPARQGRPRHRRRQQQVDRRRREREAPREPRASGTSTAVSPAASGASRTATA